MSPPAIRAYLKAVAERHRRGNATEHTYRGDLEILLRAMLPGVDITNEPRRITDCGAPDYVLARNAIPLGYIEAKDVDKSLDDKAFGDQFNRYLQSLDNLIFTNYLEFRFHRDAETKPVDTVAIAELRGGKIKPLPENFARLKNLIADFSAYQGQTITAADDLAKRMADKARLLGQVIAGALADDEENGGADGDGELQNQLKAFREILDAGIKPPRFAGIYAQTIAYGMFVARLHDPTPMTFTRHEAAKLIPGSNPFLKKFFGYIADYDLDARIRWLVDDLADIFRATDVGALMKDFGRSTQRTDPFIHFYETFLGQYDGKLRKSRGVYYTPAPAVNFIVRAVDEILKKEFKLSGGLGDTAKTMVTVDGAEKEVHKVQILDPGTGTGTFLADIVQFIHESFRGQRGVWPDYVRDDLLPRLNGFEILMAPYAMAHVKLEMILKETGFDLGGQRLRIFLTNSLENREAETQMRDIPFANWLVQEARGADEVKRNAPVMVVMGNPPYAVSSSNRGRWIQDLIADYKEGLNEKKLNLDDDYIKFIRFGEYLVDKTGEGILAYISNNSFVDGITHRRMRERLLETFDRIYVLNLHGDTRKKERAPDGSKDQNVFDIMQGVSINIFVKSNKKKNGALAEVFYRDLFGARQSKYEFLWSNALSKVKFRKLKPRAPHFFFVPKDFSAQAEYQKGFAVNALFEEYNSGIQTKRDHLTVAMSTAEIGKVRKDLERLDAEEIREKYLLPDDGRDWRVAWAKQDVQEGGPRTVSILYRPFDARKTLYTGRTKGFLAYPRHKTMRHMLDGENLALITVRQVRLQSAPAFQHAFITKSICEGCVTGEWGYVFPLYLYPDEEQTRLDGQPSRKPNLNADIVQQIAGNIDMTFTPEKTAARNAFAPVDILDYIYAVLHGPTYREKFREFLKIDFPRVPYPRDKKQFRALAKLGAELRALHLMESEKLNRLITTYPEPGDNTVTAVKFDNGKVWINKTQHFAQAPKSAWEFYIGGYQPAQKYLKDRKNRALTPDEINRYQKIIVALVETAKVMKKIDAVA
ncbi:MAG: N-6 DNA methylase [Gammaproteobacteria bacterium]|nr:N-6 DNA methylase [Gammaproteobacteria bacterium]